MGKYQRENEMDELTLLNAERLKDFRREAEHDRLVHESQKPERNLLQNALNTLKIFKADDKKLR